MHETKQQHKLYTLDYVKVLNFGDELLNILNIYNSPLDLAFLKPFAGQHH